MTNPLESHPGRVCLVGAGPGDPGLITRAGLERLRSAQVVVYDALVNPLLLEEAPAQAQRIDVGKRGGCHKLSQDQINELLLAKAREGKFVVRLKGGDPYLFGRGAEEVSYLARHGIACEVIPGVTSGLAAPAAAGIPVTHRQLASTVTLVTGHEDPTKPASAVDYAALARLAAAGGTLCLYMGAGRLRAITEALIAQGLAPDTPAAVVQWGTLPGQRSVRERLGGLADAVEQAGLGSPAIIVVGAVAGIDEPGLDFFTRRPLFGRRVLITRTRQQASLLRQQLAELGAHVLEAPTIEIVPPERWDEVDRTIRDIARYDWLVLTSINGAAALAERMSALGLDARHLAGVRVAAIGQPTAQAIRQHLGINADLVPTQFVAESLAGELIAQQDMQGKRVLLLRADIARPALPELLTQAGAQVTDLAIYQTRLARELPVDVLEALWQRQVEWVTFTSSSTARNLVQLLGEEANLLESVKIASIGPITSRTVRELGYAVAAEAKRSDIDGLVEAIVEACGEASRE